MTAGNLPQGPEVVVGEQPNMVFLERRHRQSRSST